MSEYICGVYIYRNSKRKTLKQWKGWLSLPTRKNGMGHAAPLQPSNEIKKRGLWPYYVCLFIYLFICRIFLLLVVSRTRVRN